MSALIETSAATCPKCGYDMDKYKDKGKTYYLCCACEHRASHEEVFAEEKAGQE